MTTHGFRHGVDVRLTEIILEVTKINFLPLTEPYCPIISTIAIALYHLHNSDRPPSSPQ
ncbi:hypothetical protein NWP21_04890 [Anabaenopsis sp. FSS-46]|uniref:hypothetical protein n=1 Tax=Anabaenopsis sp. FSS-46 TaxID=2971766 RepID=UPI002475F7A9|nr:hypothetical protein [Anabaenopsis sp. FSS-46]MDH6098186.1 hypothetical protein [Anabaenopsis sp. FSS-46]